MLTSRIYYLCIRKNSFEITNIENGENKFLTADKPFTTTRLLVGDFEAAESALIKLLKQIKASSHPIIVVHPLEMNEDGLSNVEERVLTEMALGAGAREAIIHNGPRLTKEEALSLASANPGKRQEFRKNGQEMPAWASAIIIGVFIALLIYLAKNPG